MAFKNLFSKAKELASDLSIVAKSLIPKTEEEKRAEEAEATQKKQAEFEKRTALPPLPTLNCPHGGCVIRFSPSTGDELICSCQQTQKCPEGKKLEYLKRTSYREDQDRMLHMMRYLQIEEGRNQRTEAEHKALVEKAITEFAKIYYPNLANPSYQYIYNVLERELSLGFRTDANKIVLEYFNQRRNITQAEDLNIKRLCDGIEPKYCWVCQRLIKEHFDLIIKDTALLNMTDYKEFRYTMVALCVALDPEGCDDVLKDKPYRADRIYELFDTEGHIKPAGLGGPEVGEIGDTIWNTYEAWLREPDSVEPCSFNAALLENP